MKYLLIFAVVYSCSAFAADKYIGDNSHTEVIFKINHLGFSTTYGRFTNVESELVYDAENPEKSTVSATIYSGSVDLGHDPKTDHIKAADFLNAEQFPKITFASTEVKSVAESQLEITGDLTIRKVTKPVILQVTINKIGKHPIYQSDAIGFSATGILDRTDWGVSAYAPMVGKEVTFNIEFEGTKTGDSYESKFAK
ncbi:YceI family protein [Porticoccus sp. W117]|uniref:YceI family protein n=1 Tax=Porticoccus sp. W117 TaxID=3054777 RepID=UPI00259A9212|nr:YceI family protein [Porticoccus sp. W117]MDM3871318.1 YceI family protein [Porticoccus sp. W117]